MSLAANGEHETSRFSRLEILLVVIFVHPTFRESLRDDKARLRVQPYTLCLMASLDRLLMLSATGPEPPDDGTDSTLWQ